MTSSVNAIEREMLGNFFPALIFPCSCGSELNEDLRNRNLVCHSCGNTVSDKHRMMIELVSRTFQKRAEAADIEGVMYGVTEFDIDEAALPTGLLPIIMTRVIQAAHLAYPNHPYLFSVGEVTTPNEMLASTCYYISVDPESTMDVKAALVIFNHVVKKMIDFSRTHDRENPVISDLHNITMSVLAEGLNSDK
ncbi:hypothetical protein [Marinobacterium stanieri]|uniref:Uncharacterized protein n=1 Tax=Marinobacterium stanieri TaxID=49186 RepID=A0A1N6XA89_9GAMM|nr:hypothetical protein [Marinobacterium stanieri]SIQ99187.1 hypothetical protein SAMN05421647_11342 [Marinobacterium stanieri]